MTPKKQDYTKDLCLKSKKCQSAIVLHKDNKEIKREIKIPIISFKNIVENCKNINDIKRLTEQVNKFK